MDELRYTDGDSPSPSHQVQEDREREEGVRKPERERSLLEMNEWLIGGNLRTRELNKLFFGAKKLIFIHDSVD